MGRLTVTCHAAGPMLKRTVVFFFLENENSRPGRPRRPESEYIKQLGELIVVRQPSAIVRLDGRVSRQEECVSACA
jgi:hypothetical protein